LIRRQIIEPLDLAVTEAVRALRVGRIALSHLTKENAALASDMALRIEKALRPKMEYLMWMQLAHGLAQARERGGKIKVIR